MKVIKFGGTSVGDLAKIFEVAKYIKGQRREHQKIVVVASAMNKSTDDLLIMASTLSKTPNKRELDRLLSIGEQQTISLLAIALTDIGISAVSLTADQLEIKTKGDFANAQIVQINEQIIHEKFVEHDVVIVAGFQGINERNEIVTLGRGGSDTTAVAIASVLKCDCEIYTDVSGIYATDPRVIPKAKKLNYISYDEMAELATLGASVMHNRSVFIAKKYGIKVYVAKSLSQEKGTYIMNKNIEENVVTAIAVDNDVINFTIKCSKQKCNILSKLALNKINIDMISQLVIDDKYIVGFSTNSSEILKVNEAIDEFTAEMELDVNINDNLAKISLVGSGMRDASGLVSRVFQTLEKIGIEVMQTTTSEITISLLVSKENSVKALEGLCQEFDLMEDK